MSEKNKLTEKEKIAIAKQASSGDEASIKKLAGKYDLTEDEIRSWVREFDTLVVEETENVLYLETSEDFEKSVTFGASFDKLNYKRLVFWSFFGSVTLMLFIVAIMLMHDYSRSSVHQDRSERSLFYDIDELQRRDRLKLESFGVVNPDEGIYRIPIDSAITNITTD